MPDVASVQEKTQVGIESAAGTPVAATKILTASMVTPGIKISSNQYRASGFKVNNLTTKGKEWTEASLAGPMTYTEIPYWLAMIMKVTTGAADTVTAATGLTPSGTSVLAKHWKFDFSDNSPDTVNTMTFEVGSTTRAKRFAYGLLTQLGFSIDRNAANLSGSILGQQLTDAFTLTSLTSTNEIALTPILPQHFNIYVAATQAGLASASALDRVFKFDWQMGSRFSPIWPLKRAYSSFGGHVETPIDLKATLTMEADSAGMAQLANLRANSTVFIRVEAAGDVIETISGVDRQYLLRIDFAGQITDPGPYADQDGVLTVSWGFTGVHDSTWAKSCAITVTNLAATL